MLTDFNANITSDIIAREISTISKPVYAACKGYPDAAYAGHIAAAVLLKENKYDSIAPTEMSAFCDVALGIQLLLKTQNDPRFTLYDCLAALIHSRDAGGCQPNWTAMTENIETALDSGDDACAKVLKRIIGLAAAERRTRDAKPSHPGRRQYNDRLIVSELQLSDSVGLGNCSLTTLYRYKARINDYLAANGYSFRVRANTQDKSLDVIHDDAPEATQN